MTPAVARSHAALCAALAILPVIWALDLPQMAGMLLYPEQVAGVLFGLGAAGVFLTGLGERTGVLEMRKNYSGYFKGFRNASKLRHQLMQPESKEGVLDVMLNFKPDAADIQIPAARLPNRPTKTKKASLPSGDGAPASTKVDAAAAGLPTSD